MGNCCNTPKSKPNRISTHQQFKRQASLAIKRKNGAGIQITTTKVTFILNQPILSISQNVKFDNSKVWVSTCVLPGQDPRGQYTKQCQDLCGFTSNQNSFFGLLFDGHGVQGQLLVQFCENLAKRYFKSQKQIPYPTRFLINVTQRCDSQVRKESCQIDSVRSGSTQVLLFIQNKTIFSASVGDSRAIVATLSPPQIRPAPNAQLGQQRLILQKLKKENEKLTTTLQAVQLTQDQKPDDPNQLQRIIRSGGRVQRLIDQSGNYVGPYRVWEKNANYPGLAMSRSIGDQAGKKLGVISTPVTTSYQLTENDYFIVAGSDGIWDVFQNQQVVNFVEYYRQRCQRGISQPPSVQKVTWENTCIAHLLCEEARHRWFTIVEEEDVLIDDISCVVIELIEEKAPGGLEYRRSESRVNMDAVSEEEHPQLQRAPSIRETKARDPRRNSIVEHPDINLEDYQW